MVMVTELTLSTWCSTLICPGLFSQCSLKNEATIAFSVDSFLHLFLKVKLSYYLKEQSLGLTEHISGLASQAGHESESTGWWSGSKARALLHAGQCSFLFWSRFQPLVGVALPCAMIWSWKKDSLAILLLGH